jgi:hypothetical protein
MLTWVTLKIAQAMFTVGTGDLSSAGKSDSSIGAALVGMAKDGKYVADPDAMGVLLKFIIVIAFMITSLLAAKKMAEKVGGGITKTALGWAGGATLGLAGRAGRGTIGRAGAGLSNSQKLKDWEEAGGAKAMSSRLALMAGNKAAKSSFDVRATKFGAKLDAGKVKKGTSFEQDVKDRTKTANDRVKFVGLDKKAREAKEAEEDARKKLAEAEKKAREESKNAHPDIKASENLKLAEEREKDARSALSKISISTTAKPEEVVEAQKKHAEAVAEAEMRREEHKRAEEELKKKRETFVENQTAAQRASLSMLGDTRQAAETKSEAFIKKQGEPVIGKKGIGEIMSAQQQANATGRHPVMKPLAWLGNKIAPVVALRGKEREDRVKAVRKEANKSKEDIEKEKQREELAKAAKEGAKDGAKDGGKDGDKKDA